jgi:hypothetical protein
MSKNEGFCTRCNYQVQTFDGLDKCPSCQTKSHPCAYVDQTNISINIHEIRLLCIWAENWASKLDKDQPHSEIDADVVYAIAERIKKQLPESLSAVPLTMRDEFMELKKKHPEFKTNHPAADTPELGENYSPNMPPIE